MRPITAFSRTTALPTTGIVSSFRFLPHLVRDYVTRFELDRRHTVLDPFCGTATTLVECQKLGLRARGLEANPMACFATQTKTDWTASAAGLWRHALALAEQVERRLTSDGFSEHDDLPLFRQRKTINLRTLSPEKTKLILGKSISPIPLHKTLVLMEALREGASQRYSGYEKLALAKALVSGISNLHFGPEVGVGRPREDAPVVRLWLTAVRAICDDLSKLPKPSRSSKLIMGDARRLASLLQPRSVDAVITSPPYPK